MTHEFIVTSRPRHSLLVSRYSTRPEARAKCAIGADALGTADTRRSADIDRTRRGFGWCATEVFGFRRASAIWPLRRGAVVVRPASEPPSAMDEILALQAALATAQDTKSSIRLSERNIVELVNKLKSLDLLDDTLLYTLNGKEYLTEARLDAEIKREVKRSGGRVPVTDLQPALNVDVAHCERRARALAAAASNGVALVEGELITPARARRAPSPPRRTSGAPRGGRDRRGRAREEARPVRGLDDQGAARARVEAGAVDGRRSRRVLATPPATSAEAARAAAWARCARRSVPTARDALARQRAAAGGQARRRRRRPHRRPTGGPRERESPEGRPEAREARLLAGGARGRNDGPPTPKTSPPRRAPRRRSRSPAVSIARAQAAAVGEVYARAGVVTAEQATRMGVADPSSYFEAMEKNRAVALGESFVAPRVVEQLDAAVRDALAENGGGASAARWCRRTCRPRTRRLCSPRPTRWGARTRRARAREAVDEEARPTLNRRRRKAKKTRHTDDAARSGSVLRRSAERRRTGRASRRATLHAQQIASRASGRARRLRDARARARAQWMRARSWAAGAGARRALFG